MEGRISFEKNIHMRPATPADKPRLSTLFHQTRDFIYEYADAEYDYKKVVVEQQESFREQGYGSQFPNALEFVVEYQGEFIGRVMIDFSHDVIHVVDIALIKQAQGKGFGETVLRGIQKAAQSTGAPVTLVVANSNIPAKGLYKKLGFTVEDKQEIYQRLIWYPSAIKTHVGLVD